MIEYVFTATLDPGLLRLRPVDPEADAALLHDFVTRPHTRFWGMRDDSRDQVKQVYAFVDSLDTHHAYMIELDGEPVGIFQTYEPAADPVGERYEVRPGDVGMHLLLARPGLGARVCPALWRYLLADPSHDRVVAEPDVRNEAMLHRLTAEGFTLDREIDMPTKRARLAFLTRSAFEARAEMAR